MSFCRMLPAKKNYSPNSALEAIKNGMPKELAKNIKFLNLLCTLNIMESILLSAKLVLLLSYQKRKKEVKSSVVPNTKNTNEHLPNEH